MSDRLLVKVCGMRDTQNISEVGQLCPDFMGFVFVSTSPRAVPETFTKASLGDLSPTTVKIGVFSNDSSERIIMKATDLLLDGVQLHGTETKAQIRELKSALPQLKILKACSLAGAADLDRLADFEEYVDLFVFDGSTPGSGSKFDWTLLDRYQLSTPFLLAGGIGPDDIGEVRELTMRVKGLVGIDINSKVESGPGVKDLELVRQSVEGCRF